MELKNLQSTYDYLKGRCSKTCGHLLATQLPNVESILPSVYGDIAVSNIGVVADVETLGELSSVVQKLGSIVKDRATKKQCLPKMWYDDSSHDDLQAYYEMLVANVSSWTKRRLKASGLNDVKNLVPWLEGRYVCFSCLLSEGSRTAVEIDELLSKLHEKLKLLNRERWIQNEGVRVTSKGEARMLAQSKLDSLVLTLSKRARTVLENNGLDSVEMLAPWLNDEQRTFTNFHYCGIAISTELEDMVLKLRSYLDTLDGARIGVSKTTPQHAITAEETGPEIPVEGNSAIEEKYRALVGTLSVRALNVMKRNGLVSEEAFRKYAVDHKFNFMRLNWCGERTAEELRCFAKDVYSNSTPERGSQTTPYDSDVVGRLQVMVDEYLADKSNRTRTQMSARGLDKVG